jgi:hypothetical protein
MKMQNNKPISKMRIRLNNKVNIIIGPSTVFNGMHFARLTKWQTTRVRKALDEHGENDFCLQACVGFTNLVFTDACILEVM